MPSEEKEELKFFCENCGKEVKRDASFCPHCGRFFASVRCPACNYKGIASQFKNGCPRCGYSIHSKDNKKGYCHDPSTEHNREEKQFAEGGLPLWIYATVFGIFLIVVAIILFR